MINNIEELNDCNLKDIRFIFEDNTIVFHFTVLSGKERIIKFENIIHLQYNPDYSDLPPALCLEFNIKEINKLEELSQEEILWDITPREEMGQALEELNFPVFRVTMQSGDFYSKIVCFKITEITP